MAIKRINLEEFLIFKDRFTADFCSGINILIGGNGTGKTTLMKILYAACNFTESFTSDGCSMMNVFFGYADRNSKNCTEHPKHPTKIEVSFEDEKRVFLCPCDSKTNPLPKKSVSSVFIPEKDMLANSKGIPESYKYGKADYTKCEVDIIEKARVLADSPEQPLYRKICDIIKGEPQNDGQSFFMKRYGIDTPVPFSLEASGYRKFGLLATLIRNEQIKSKSILFWDELENSLNPELVPTLVDILLELQRNGVQIFIATHSYDVARWFELKAEKEDKLKYFNFKKTENGVECTATADNYKSLEDSVIENASDNLYNAVMFKINGERKNG